MHIHRGTKFCFQGSKVNVTFGQKSVRKSSIYVCHSCILRVIVPHTQYPF